MILLSIGVANGDFVIQRASGNYVMRSLATVLVMRIVVISGIYLCKQYLCYYQNTKFLFNFQ